MPTQPASAPTAVTRPQPFKQWKPPFRYESVNSSIVDKNNVPILEMRGWGHLTGGLRLNPTEAINIQNEAGKRIAELLTLDAKGKLPTGTIPAQG